MAVEKHAEHASCTPTPEELRSDPAWAQALNVGFIFWTQAHSYISRSIAENLSRLGFQVHIVRRAWKFGNPSLGEQLTNFVALFVRPLPQADPSVRIKYQQHAVAQGVKVTMAA